MTTPALVPDPSALADVDALFGERVESQVTPSVAYGVLAGGRLVHSGGFGTADDAGTVPTADTAYRIASCTKSFTVAALLVLRDRDRLDLDRPVTDFVPGAVFRLPTPYSRVPTVRMLMSMSGGLPTDDAWADRQESQSAAEFDALLAAGIRFVTVPGTAYEYSNLGFALLGRVIEVVSGRGYREFVSTEVLEPAGLAATGFTSSVEAPDGVATGYRRIDGRWTPLPFSDPGAFSSIGGLFSTVTDLARWMGTFIDAFSSDTPRETSAAMPGDHRATGDSPALLAPSSRREMQQLHRVVAPGPDSTAASVDGYGFGLFVQHHPGHGLIASHSGGYPGFSSHMRWHPASGLGVVALENGTYSGASLPVTTSLTRLLDRSGYVRASAPVWTETAAARRDVESLLAGWDEQRARQLFADNVDLDDALARRRAHLADAVAAVGGLTTGQSDASAADGAVSQSAAHLRWTVRGVTGRLRCEIRLNPQDPPRVQTLIVEVELDD